MRVSKGSMGNPGINRPNSGFSLVEMMAAVTVFGILMAIAIPQLYSSMDNIGSRQDAEALGGRLRLARSQAISSSSDVIVYFNRDGVGTYTVHLDNGGGIGNPSDATFVASNKNNGVLDPNEQIMQTIPLEGRTVFGYVPGGMTSSGEFLTAAISFPGNPANLVFHANGTSDQSGWISIMPLEDFLEQDTGRDYLIEVTSSTGEVRVKRTEY